MNVTHANMVDFTRARALRTRTMLHLNIMPFCLQHFYF